MNLSNEFNEVEFDPIRHVYTHRFTGIQFISWSGLKKKYSAEFDPEGAIAARCAKKEGITVKEIKARWKAESDASLAFGTDIHAGLENYYRQQEFAYNENQQFWLQQVQADKLISQIFPLGEAISEQLLYCVKSRIAGTTDLMRIHKGRIHLGDFKTNKKIDFYNVFNNFFLHPFENIPDISGTAYALQLSVYMVLACRMTGLKAGSITLIHLDKVKGKLVTYQPALMLETAEKIISLAKQYSK